VSIPVLECPGGWENTCGCPRDHNYCWPRPDTRCCDALTITDETTPEQAALIERMLRMSVEILHGMSGRQFGLCRRTIRPCREECGNGMARPPWGWAANGGILEPVLDGGQWYNNPCGKCVTDCSCTSVCEMTLPPLARSVVEVRLDGEVLPAWMYRIDNHRKLVRTGAYGPLAVETGLGVVLSDFGPVVCDLTPAPDTVTDATGPVSGCYTPTATNPSWLWNAASSVEWTFDATAVNNADTAFFDGPYPTGTTYAFGPAGTVLTSGEHLDSELKPDGSFMRITVLAGQATRVATPYTFEVVPGTRLRMERFGRMFGADVECWPTCQDMSLPATEPNTFEVTYLRGKPVPEYGLWAAGLLACELIKACAGPGEDCECRLPSNVQSVVREGVSIDLEVFRLGGNGDPLFGRTGIPEVDLWLSSVNPNKVTSRSRAYSPDRRPPRRTTWPCD
jgi:hypothetical protein